MRARCDSTFSAGLISARRAIRLHLQDCSTAALLQGYGSLSAIATCLDAEDATTALDGYEMLGTNVERARWLSMARW
jgi:hypothetical protein